jgi:class 3 adenylate cyclase
VNTEISERDCLAACAMTDAEGYTGVAERMEPPELVELVNRYFRALFRAVLGNGGLVLDVKGDGILAVWTNEAPDAALRAQVCRSCLQMLEACDRFVRQHGTWGPARAGPFSFQRQIRAPTNGFRLRRCVLSAGDTKSTQLEYRTWASTFLDG